MHSARPTLDLLSENLHFGKTLVSRPEGSNIVNHPTIQGEQGVLSPFYRREN